MLTSSPPRDLHASNHALSDEVKRLKDQLVEAEATAAMSADELKYKDMATATEQHFGDLESDVTRFVSSNFNCLAQNLLSSDEFNAIFARIFSLGIKSIVERGMHMDRSDVQFQEALQKVSNFVLGANTEFDEADPFGTLNLKELASLNTIHPSFNPPAVVVSLVLVVVAPRAVDLAESPMSTSIDQDAPSTSIPSTQEQEHSLIISQGSSSNVRPIYTLFESLGRWTKDHPIANVIGDPSRSVSTRKQLQTDAMWCYFDAFLTSVEPKNFKQAMTEPSWIDAMQEEIHEFERLQVWELVPCPDKVMLIKLKWIYMVKTDEFGSVLKNKARLVA
ncbi:integrase, catalytic region, zinc finger, CCHC-type containing protein [Tanacetum coccineum]